MGWLRRISQASFFPFRRRFLENCALLLHTRWAHLSDSLPTWREVEENTEIDLFQASSWPLQFFIKTQNVWNASLHPRRDDQKPTLKFGDKYSRSWKCFINIYRRSGTRVYGQERRRWLEFWTSSSSIETSLKTWLRVVWVIEAQKN